MATDTFLISNGSASTTGIAIQGGYFCFDVAGTFSGATVGLERLGPDGTTWLSMGADAALTAAGIVFVSLPSGKYRVNISGGPPSGIYARLSRVDLRNS